MFHLGMVTTEGYPSPASPTTEQPTTDEEPKTTEIPSITGGKNKTLFTGSYSTAQRLKHK